MPNRIDDDGMCSCRGEPRHREGARGCCLERSVGSTVIVCGSRLWTDVETIRAWLSRLPNGTTVAHGACRGADRIAGGVAEELGLDVRAYPADWDAHGDAAGPIRNQLMVDTERAHLRMGLAFTWALEGPREKRTGTGDCVVRLVEAGVRVTIVPPGVRP
jgi:hypothetical protein